MGKVELLAGDRISGETSRAIQGCNDYLRMGPGRSLYALRDRYAGSHQITPPTSYLDTLKMWSAKYGWVARAELYDAELERIKNERHREIMESGLALNYERVQELKYLAGFLLNEIEEANEQGERPKVWVPDVKQIGSGEFSERVDIVRYNSAIFSDLRGVLDDLAKETGGRVTKQDIRTDGELVFKVVYENGTNGQAEETA